MVIRIMCFISLILTLLMPFTAAAEEVYIEVNNLNVRNGPSAEHESIDQVNEGERYNLLDEIEGWVKIQLAEYSGWVSKDYVTIDQADTYQGTEENFEDVPLTSVTIQVDGTHLRAGASTKEEIAAFADEGQEFDVVSETENWLEISDGETTGFVLRSNIIDVNDGNDSLDKKTIVIDPGHGGRDVGAIGTNGSYEKDIAYLTAYALEIELTTLGAEVILTRQADEFIPLGSRTALSNSIETDAFLSIHYNSFPEVPSVTGVETYYYHNLSENLATQVHKELIKVTGERDRGISVDDFHVIRQTFKPGILLELGFISNDENEAKLQTNGYQKKIVSGIVRGLQSYISAH